MIWNTIKNYFKSYKNILTPLGGILLFGVIGFGIGFGGIKGAINTMIQTLTEIINNIELNVDAGMNVISSSLLTLDWNDPQATALALTQSDFIGKTLGQAVVAMIGGEEVTQNITDTINVCLSSIMLYVILFFVFCFIGVIVGYIFLRIQMRSEFAKRKWWQGFLAVLCETTFTIVMVIVATQLASMWIYSLIFTVLFMILSYGFFGLVEGFLFHAKGKMTFKEVVSGKNMLLHIASTLIIYLISATMILIMYFIFKGLVTLLLGISILEITFVAVGLNAESYVRSLVHKPAKKTKEAEAK